MKFVTLIYLALAAVLFSNALNASATSADFKKCEKLAVAALSSCLQINDKGNCWKKSEASYQYCIGKFKKHYYAELHQRRKEAKIEAMQQKKQAASLNSDNASQ